MKESSGKLICRSKTSDVATLMETFLNHFHNPPSNLDRDAIILDLGSNVGYTLVNLHYYYPNAKFIGVEMDKENYDFAMKNVTHIKNCVLINAACWKNGGEITYCGKESNSFSICTSNYTNQKHVKAITIDQIMNYTNIEYIDFIKMDIEGAETEVICNFGNWINKTNSMNIELHYTDGSEIIKCLMEHGFNCYIDTNRPYSVLALKE